MIVEEYLKQSYFQIFQFQEVLFMINDYEATKPITTDATTGGSTTASNDDVISTLNGLIETCKDGQDGFKEAAEGVERSDLKSLFYEFSQQRSQFAGELQELVRTLGGDPENSGSMAAALHRGWINIKSAVTGKDEGAILNECERGEDVAKNAYKEALEEALPANVLEVVQTQYTAVQAAHDRVKALRDAANNDTTDKSKPASTSY
jgi:uncharacterized protein (TIGR02284 family)